MSCFHLFVSTRLAINKLLTSEDFRMCSIDPNAIKLELHIIQIMHLAIRKKLQKQKYKNLPIRGILIHIKI